MGVVGIKVAGHGFSDSVHRDEFKAIQHDYIQTNQYRDLGWSDNFDGLGVMVIFPTPSEIFFNDPLRMRSSVRKCNKKILPCGRWISPPP